MYYTCDDHEKLYKSLVYKYEKYYDNEYKVLFYLLAATSNIRAHLSDCIETNLNNVHIKTDALHHGWVTGADARFIRLAFNLYNSGIPTALDLSGEALDEELNNYTPSHIFSGLDESNLKAALAGLYLWSNLV